MSVNLFAETYLCMVLIITISVLGLRMVTDNGKIGYPIRKFFIDHYTPFNKPLILCAACMPSVWGSIIFLVVSLQLINYENYPLVSMVIIWILAVVSSSFTAGFLWKLFESLK